MMTCEISSYDNPQTQIRVTMTELKLFLVINQNRILVTGLQSWTFSSGHLRNMAKGGFFANLPKVLIFDLLARRVTINDFL